MKKLMIFIAAAPLLLWGTSVAQSPHAEDQCLDVRAHVTVSGFAEGEDCTHDGETFLFCFTADLIGKSKGTWFTGIKDEWDGLFVDDAILADGSSLPTPEGTANWWWREFEVFTLQGGTLTGDAQYVIDTRIYDVDAALPIPITVTGGTGIFEDASGWMLATFEDTFFVQADLFGEVCGPHVPPPANDKNN